MKEFSKKKSSQNRNNYITKTQSFCNQICTLYLRIDSVCSWPWFAWLSQLDEPHSVSFIIKLYPTKSDPHFINKKNEYIIFNHILGTTWKSWVHRHSNIEVVSLFKKCLTKS